MQDLFHLPPDSKGDIQIFRNTTGVDLKGWQTWIKPKGAVMVYMWAIGGGGGGGGGFTRAAGGAGGGGAGGACSCITKAFYPAFALPDQLFVQAGMGGQGGAASAAGGAGLNSYVAMSPFAVAGIPLLLWANTTPPGGGGAGTVGAGGTGGTVPTLPGVSVFTQMWGLYTANAAQIGLVGAAGGAQTGAAGGNAQGGSIWPQLYIGPGAGGAGCTTTEFSGGRQVPSSTHDFIGFTASGDIVGQATAIGQNGGNGLQLWKPYVMTGGGGGASSNSGQAGSGGNGGVGCGGGGGAAGTTGGRGGNGGDGMVIIISV